MSNILPIADAERILWELSDLDPETATSERRSQIREALDYLTKQADYHIFGICADTTQEALQSLQSYAEHFRYELPENNALTAIADGVYLKYNPRSLRYHIDNSLCINSRRVRVGSWLKYKLVVWCGAMYIFSSIICPLRTMP